MTLETQTQTAHKCDWCSAAIDCTYCPRGAYHMHDHCYKQAVAAGYFAKLDAPRRQIPVPCRAYMYASEPVYHFVLGYVP